MRSPLLFLLTLSTSTALATVPIVDAGRPVAKIYLSPSADQGTQSGTGAPPRPLEIAVEELNSHIEKITGTRLEVEKAGAASEIKGPAIVLGRLAAESGADLAPTQNRDSLRLLTRGSRVLIAGETDEATLNGVYSLLNRLGCEWVMPGAIGEIIPKQTTLAVPDLDVTEQPAFPIRNIWYRGGKKLNTAQDIAEFDLWKRRQRLNDWPRLKFGEGHVWGLFIKRHAKEFAADPTMLALVRDADGKLVRRGPQIETTHPRVIELFVQDIKEDFETNKWPKDKAVAFGIGPADGDGFSISAESTMASSGRMDPMLGLPDSTDLIVLLGNQILERLGSEYPNVSLGFYSYSTHADYPLKYKPHPRLNIIFAPISFSRFQSVADENSKTWPFYRSVVELWGKLGREQGNQFVYRGYNWNLAENMMPYSKLRIVGEEIPWYKENGIIAFNVEASKAWAVNGPHDFLMAKLLWNASLNWKDVLHSYCRASFGRGAAAMEKYFLALTERQRTAGQEAGSYYAFPLIYDQSFVTAGKTLIQTAVSEAEAPEEKTRAGYFLYPLESLELFLQFHQAGTQFDFVKAAALYKQMNDNWQKAYDLNTNLVAKEVPGYLKRFLEKFVNQAVTYSTEPYQIVYRIPDLLPTMLDPNGVGEQLNFQGPALNDALFMRTRTWSATWDSQGLGAYRTGSVWYRIGFDLPGDLKEKPLGLFIGGAEDEVFVWLNGRFIGSGRGFSVPFVFDLSDAARAGERNLLAVKVVRNSAINEIGLGGLLRPSFLFTGPRVESTAPSRQLQPRILPGGEIEDAPPVKSGKETSSATGLRGHRTMSAERGFFDYGQPFTSLGIGFIGKISNTPRPVSASTSAPILTSLPAAYGV